MTLQVIGTGVGRTGTYSLKAALEQLDLGPCHHMRVVVENMGEQVTLWRAALDGAPDFAGIYAGFTSAVDWPTAGFYRELYAAYPQARFIHTYRSAESWAESFGSTIYKVLQGRDEAPSEVGDWLGMVVRVLEKSGFRLDLDYAGLAAGFEAHNAAVEELIPAEQLLMYQVTEGWEPLCGFLDVPAPDEAFPRTNNREEFWELVKPPE